MLLSRRTTYRKNNSNYLNSKGDLWSHIPGEAKDWFSEFV